MGDRTKIERIVGAAEPRVDGRRERGRSNHKRIVAAMMALIESGDLKPTAMITHRGPLAEVPALMPQWCDPATGVVKAMVTCDTHPDGERRQA